MSYKPTVKMNLKEVFDGTKKSPEDTKEITKYTSFQSILRTEYYDFLFTAQNQHQDSAEKNHGKVIFCHAII